MDGLPDSDSIPIADSVSLMATVPLTAEQNVGLRWRVIAMAAAAIAISYFDRQTISVAITAIQKSLPITEEQFSYLQTAFLLMYAALYVLGGRLLDRLGTRRGFLLIMLWWSVACMLHGFARGFLWLLVMRCLLGIGEGGAFPAASRVVSEWLSPNERSMGMGIINAGTAVGSVLAPPLIGVVILLSGWRAVFFVAGGIGLLWVVWWACAYRDNPAHLSRGTGDLRMLGRKLTFAEIVSMRNVRSLVFAKFMSDSAGFFMFFWLPKYLFDARGFDVRQASFYAWIPYAASGIGCVAGGWWSSHLLCSGKSLDFARKLVLGVNAFMMPSVMLVPLVSARHALLLFCIVFFSLQSWSTIVMTIVTDVFPLSAVGTVAGLVGFGGSIGGAIFSLVAGALLGRGFSYQTLFVIAGTFHIIGFLNLVFLGGRIQPLPSAELERIESEA
jgi:MFS transporter, ACS family, hexuronate transporter